FVKRVWGMEHLLDHKKCSPLFRSKTIFAVQTYAACYLCIRRIFSAPLKITQVTTTGREPNIG
ncbi:hypothetical protein, partial [Microvirga soli]|uniref:hypothetical protein n=1 Tax=Microvirga soli TaxID=1854496 RepID=UPI001AEF17D1